MSVADEIKALAPWAESLPNDWRLTRLDRAADVLFSNVDKHMIEGERPVRLCNYIDAYKNDRITGAIKFMEASADEREIAKFQILRGDVIATKDSEEADDIAIPAFVEEELPGVLCGYHLGIIRPRLRTVSGRFLFWLHASKSFRAQYEANAVGVTRFGLAQHTFRQARIPLPSLPEQERIATYLDASCAAIDAAVAAKRRQLGILDLLFKTTMQSTVTRGVSTKTRLKDSGYQWLGSIPADWRLVAIKRIVATKITDGPHETPELSETGVQFISAEAIKDGQINFNLRRGFISRELHEQYCRKCKPQQNDIFVVKSGATTGNVAYVDVDFEFSIWSPLALIRCDKRFAHYKFIYYVLLTDVFKKQVELSWSFGTQQNIGMRVIERLKVPLPSLREQLQIVEYLDAESSKTTGLKQNIQSQIVTLSTLRRSLIYECVTGERRLSDKDLQRICGNG
jgi:type I restriction enzyme S subunit